MPLVADSLPSSHVSRTSVFPAWYADDEKILGRSVESQVSPVWTRVASLPEHPEVQCMLSQTLGVIQVNAARLDGSKPASEKPTSFLAHEPSPDAARSVYQSGGLWPVL